MNEETKKKISNALMGHKMSENTKIKISSSLLGKKKTQLHKKRISEAMVSLWAKRHNYTTCRGNKTCKFARADIRKNKEKR
ncbi:MAG: hypothetical protein MJZ76_08025 [Bacteroidales bacterium]|nr:hypothetical protein [Bacteroidales bacterium]